MKKIGILIVFILTQSLFAQQELVSFNNYLKTSSGTLKDVIPIVNQKNGDISVFFIDSKKVYGYLLDSTFKVVNKTISDEKNRKFKTIIGNSISDNNQYRIYLTNTKGNKFATINFSYATNNSSIKELNVNLTDEKLVETITHENKFYLLTITKESSKLNIYSFDNDANHTKKTLDFSDSNIVGSNENEITLSDLLTKSSMNTSILFNFSSDYIDIAKIEENNPNPIDLTSKHSKLYHKNGEIIISFDQHKDFTQIIMISLHDFDKNYRRIEKPFNKLKDNRKETNSYIYNDTIFMIASTKEKFVFCAKNFQTGSLLKEYSANVDEPISFKNSPIIQVGGEYDKYREMEKTKKFLRKITAGDIGLSIYKINNKYQIILGGKVEMTRNNVNFGPSLPTTTTIQTSLGPVQIQHFNPTFNSFNYYTRTKSTYIKCLFDLSLNHLEGTFSDNAFDKIKDFKEKKKTLKRVKTVFKYGNHYILANYLSGKKEYILRKFTN